MSGPGHEMACPLVHGAYGSNLRAFIPEGGPLLPDQSEEAGLPFRLALCNPSNFAIIVWLLRRANQVNEKAAGARVTIILDGYFAIATTRRNTRHD